MNKIKIGDVVEFEDYVPGLGMCKITSVIKIILERIHLEDSELKYGIDKPNNMSGGMSIVWLEEQDFEVIKNTD